MSQSTPTFAVVGQVNKGKSSVISTLIEDDRVAISARPGETRACHSFPVLVDGVCHFTLVDTPGFEDASRALRWLRETSPSAGARPGRLREFVTHFSKMPPEPGETRHPFQSECQLLRPILDGAAIIYVVDGSRRYKPHFDAEMEILHWAGRPAIAVINQIADGDHSQAWRAVLKHYFQVVRPFNAHTASFEERVGLLRTFRELADEWRAPLDVAIDALERERRFRRERVVDRITELLIRATGFTLDTWAKDDEEVAAQEKALTQRFHDQLRELERAARRDIAELYHHHARWSVPELERPVFDQDLFAKATWLGLGLSPRQLLAASTVAGGLVGGKIDAVVGGASFGTGIAVGAFLGGASAAYQLRTRYASVRGLSQALRDLTRGHQRKRFSIGPHQNTGFPFVLLDRAILHFDSVRRRAHARRDPHDIVLDVRPTERLSIKDRATLYKLFGKVRKKQLSPDATPPPELVTKLRASVQHAVDLLDA